MQILAKQIGDPKAVDFAKIAEAVLEYAEKDAVRLIASWGEKMTQDWEGPPSFETKAEIVGGDIIVSSEPVGPNAQKWTWISRGTGQYGEGRGAYDIYPTGHPSSPRYNPSGPKALTVAPYAPHTFSSGVTVRGGAFGGGPGRRGAVTLRKHVIHPGIKPRHFEEGWAHWARLWWGPGIRDAIKKATK